MIRQSIKPGTKVWHQIAGIGVFKNYTADGDAIIDFGDELIAIPRKDLTEVEEK